MNIGRGRSRTGVHAAIAAIVTTAGLGAVGVAGAEEAVDADVYAREVEGRLCFSTDPASACDAGETADVAIEAGETVTFHFDGTALPHNAQEPDGEPAWAAPDSGYVSSGSYPETFASDGVYEFVCWVHPQQMSGTVTVGDGGSTPTPSPTATQTATPTPTPTVIPQPGGGGHVDTPAPSGESDDTVEPKVRGVRLKARRRAVRVRFRLSEPATVTIRVKRRGSRKVLKSARVQAPAGKRTVTLRSKRLRKGRYTLQIQARDAFGNVSSRTTKRLSLRR